MVFKKTLLNHSIMLYLNALCLFIFAVDKVCQIGM